MRINYNQITIGGRLRQVEALEGAFAHQVVCFTMIDREERLATLSSRITTSWGRRLVCTLYAYRYFPGWFFLSVHDARATKDQGIRTLIELCGLQGSDLVVFGDDVNDLGMFSIATRALATANARPELKSVAHEVIGSNGEDSVVRWISAHFQSLRDGA